ncbi:MAG: single-stranded-DNA-specific exonuclease RecJ, partial [Clostridiales bacterium]|nr:single-stranded-DNA-specific exonuclease RecJ [Clostridiales bacterium]
NKSEIEQLANNLGITKTTAKLLLNRDINNIEEAKTFLNPSLDKLYDPFLLKDMDKAVLRIEEAIKNKESIWIYGDYDVDGVSSVSILLKYFENANYKANFYIPNRIEEGYGINKDAIGRMYEEGANLIITVDCGITSVEEIDYAKKLGIDVIITDHHQCQETLPNAYAIINPKQEDCKYPCDILCGCGIAFKLIQALTPKESFSKDVYNYLDIVAIATVADVVPLIDENRIIVSNALNYINNTKNIGLKSLLEITKLNDKKINTGHIGFVIAPRINAAGRIGSADLGVKLLTTDDIDEARELASLLEKENQDRQEIENKILKEALEIIEQNPKYKKDKVLVLYGENWHQGVIGIVASRILELYHKPVIIFTKQENIAKGSARSIPSFDIFESLNLCKEIFISFGGHKQAAGLSLKIEDIEILREKINNIADEILTDEDLIPKIYCDGYLALEDINNKLLDELNTLEPFGLGNPNPRFINLDLKAKDVKSVGVDNKHLKMCVENHIMTFDSIGFNLGQYSSSMNNANRIAALFTPEYNEFNGHTKIQLNLKDLKVINSNNIIDEILERNYYNSINFTNENKTFISYENGDNYYPVDFTQNKGNSLLNFIDNYRNDKILILVNTLQGAQSLIKILEIRNMDMDTGLKIHYNNIIGYSNSNIDIVINPNIDKIQYKLYNSIIIYDMLFSENDYLFLLNNTRNIDKKFFYSNNDEKKNVYILKKIIPTRKKLVEIYRYLRRHGTLSNISIDAIILDMQKSNLDINRKLLEHAIIIFAEGKLLNYSFKKDKYNIQILDAKEKINIENLSTFKFYNNFIKEFINFKDKWLNNVRGGKNHGFI